MVLKVKIVDTVLQRFPDLMVVENEVRNIKILKVDSRLEQFKNDVIRDIERRFTLPELKNAPIFRAYRDFFWRIKIDPTKIRPAAEALIRRVLGGRAIPRINTAVDAYNLASMTTCVALAAFDIKKINGDIIMRFASIGESFLGIGMDKPLTLTGGELVMEDEERLLAIYPYRDADFSKITLKTEEMIIISCGVPGIFYEQLKKASDKATDLIRQFCDKKY